MREIGIERLCPVFGGDGGGAPHELAQKDVGADAVYAQYAVFALQAHGGADMQGGCGGIAFGQNQAVGVLLNSAV